MSDLQHEYNFNDPLELTKIFRLRSGDLYTAVSKEDPDNPLKEYASKVLVNWEDIKILEEYPYPDDWTQYKGEKYYITLHNHPHDFLILGNFRSICNQYKIFRNQFPLFMTNNDDDEWNG